MLSVQKILIMLITLCTLQNKPAENFISKDHIQENARKWICTYVAPLKTPQQRIIFNMLFILHKNSLLSSIRKNSHLALLGAMQLESQVHRIQTRAPDMSMLVHNLELCASTLAMRAEATELLEWMDNYINVHGDDDIDQALEALRTVCTQEIESETLTQKNIFEDKLA